MSCFVLKLFTTVTFCDSNTCISDAQFGFKKGGSTVDAIFALDTLIKHYQNNNKRMYVECIDLNKCFDSMYRNALWFKLFNSGIQGKVLQIIRNMYQSVTSCVKHCNSFSDYFEYSIGLRQGEIMSPVLVSLFSRRCGVLLQGDINSGLLIDDLVLIILLVEDDMAIIGKTPEDLQHNLDLLLEYKRLMLRKQKTWYLEKW